LTEFYKTKEESVAQMSRVREQTLLLIDYTDDDTYGSEFNIIDPRRLDYKMPVTENKPVSNEPNYYRSLNEREETNENLDECSVGNSYNQHSENLFQIQRVRATLV
jgi:hypothetical protein